MIRINIRANTWTEFLTIRAALEVEVDGKSRYVYYCWA